MNEEEGGDGATAKEAGPVAAESVDGVAALGKIHLQGLDRVQVELLTAGRAALAQLLHLLHELALVLGHTPERIFASKRALERMQTHTEHVEHTHTQSYICTSPTVRMLSATVMLLVNTGLSDDMDSNWKNIGVLIAAEAHWIRAVTDNIPHVHLISVLERSALAEVHPVAFLLCHLINTRRVDALPFV